MSSNNLAPRGDDDLELVYPSVPAPGSLVAVARKSSRNEILELQASGVNRVWTVRAVIGTAIQLSGNLSSTINSRGESNFQLNENPLSMYLHSGGHKAVYYDLRSVESGVLAHIDVQVESELPSNALVVARGPVNALLDVLTRDSNLPLLIQRLELLSPKTGEILVFEMLFPQGHQVSLGPLGGIMQSVPFAPYDAIYREALISSSPFYRLLCAARMFEGAGTIRKSLKEECERRGVVAQLAKIPKVDPDLVRGMGVPDDLFQNAGNAQQLYEKFTDMRNAIAHFLFKEGQETSHVYLADGRNLAVYSAAGSSLLYYAHQMLEELRIFYSKHLPRLGSQILPMLSYRERFIVKAKDYGLR
jgi:hypothetical protein